MSIQMQDNFVREGSAESFDNQDGQVRPDVNQLSVLSGMVMLVYAVMPFLKLPGKEYAVQLPGVYLAINVNIASLASLLVAFLAASGMNWLIQSHPSSQEISPKTRLLQHSILPALTAWTIGVPLQILEIGPQWWAVFAFGGVLLVMVFISELIVVDSTDTRHPPAAIALTGVSFALFLILASAIRAANLRLYLVLPALVFTIFLVSMRTIYLRTGHWSPIWSMVISMMIGQLVTGLHYWPLTPLKFGLIVLGPAYALTSTAGAREEGQAWKDIWIEPVLMLSALWLLAYVLKI